MPNWCKNTLTITGTADQVISFIGENRGDSTEGDLLLFSKSVPEPDHIYYQVSGIAIRSQWRYDNWGVDNEPKILDFSVSDQEVNNQLIKTATYKFKTAWSPGDVWCKKVIEKYPKIKFCLVYGESGSDFSGIIVGVEGNIVISDSGAFSDYLSKEF